jgi:hypothetical protein
MPEYSAGSASVRIRPNADDFIRDLRAKLNATKDPGFQVAVHADVSAASRELAEWEARQGKDGIDVDVEADTAGASGHLAVWRKEEQGKDVTITVKVDRGAADREISGLQRSLNNLGRSDALRINLGAGVLAGLQPAIAGLGEFAASLQEVAQAGLVVPGVISGVLASAGTLAVGVGGISQAWKDATAAADESGAQQASAARTAASASNNLRNALVDEAQARKDVSNAVRDARDQYRDLNLEMRGGLISESRAILNAKQARERLARGQYTDLRDAYLDVEEADQRVLEVRQRNAETTEKLNEANAKGIAGADNVVAANERLVRSQQQVADSQSAVAASAGGMDAAQQKAADSMAKLSPNARKFLETMVGMRKEFIDFRSSISQPLFEGKAEEAQQFFAKLEPTVKRGAVGIATAWNHNITAALGSLSDEKGVGLIDRILGNTGNAQERLTGAIDPIVKAVGTLSAAGSDSLPRLADGLEKAATRFDHFIERADASGDLDKWINDGLTGLTQLGSSVLNVGKSFTDITKAVNAGGGRSFLEWLEQSTNHMHALLSSAEGQNKIQEFLRDGRDAAAEFKPLLQELPGLFKTLADSGSLYVGGLLPLLTNVAKLLNEHPDLVKVAIAAYAGWQTVKPFINIASSSIQALGDATIGVGTNFYKTRDAAKTAMDDVDKTFSKAGKEGSGLKSFSKGIAALGSSAIGSGVIGVLAAVAIPGLIAAYEHLDQKEQESAKVTSDLKKAQEDLETTVDRVTGKLTAQSRQSLIGQAQQYDSSGRPGGGVEGISKGDALAAAQKLGIPPDLYADALEGKPEAQAKVRDILTKNNIGPEITANSAISGRVQSIIGQSDGRIDQNLIVSALLGDPGAVQKYNEAIDAASKPTADRTFGRPDLLHEADLGQLAQMFGSTGRESLLAGGAMNFINQGLGGVGGPTRAANEAMFGRYRVKAGQGGVFPDNAYVGRDANDYKIVLPGSLRGALDAQKIPYTVNDVDGTLTASVPLDSPFIERYDRGGPTPWAKGPVDAKGGYLSIMHPKEYVANARGRAVLGDEFLGKANLGMVDIGSLPGFEPGGPGDQPPPFDFQGIATGQQPGGQIPGPVAPNPSGGGVDSIINSTVSGLQGPINNGLGLLNQFMSGAGVPGGGGLLGGTGLGGGQADPGWGPGGAPIGLGGGPPGPNGQAPFDIRKFGIGPGPAGSGPTDWMNWTANWAGKTLGQGASILAHGFLDGIGLGGILDSPYANAATSLAGHFAGAAGMGGQSGGSADLSGLNLNGPFPNDAVIDPVTGAAIPMGNGGVADYVNNFAASIAHGQKYQYGGIGNEGRYDCSGVASAIYAAATGKPQGVRYFTTESDFEALGFRPGYMPGALNIGVRRGGGGMNSHMALTLPNGVHVESGGASDATVYGGSAAGAEGFPLHWYLPLGDLSAAQWQRFIPQTPIPAQGLQIPGPSGSGGGAGGAGGGPTPPPAGTLSPDKIKTARMWLNGPNAARYQDMVAGKGYVGPDVAPYLDALKFVAGQNQPPAAPPAGPPPLLRPGPNAEVLPVMPGPGGATTVFNPLLLPQYHRDSGGPLPTGTSIVHNGTGGLEYVLNRPSALAAAHALSMPSFAAGGPGDVIQARAVLPTPPPAPPPRPDIIPMQPRPVPQQQRPAPQQPAPAPPTTAVPTAPAAQQPAQPKVIPQQVAPGPSPSNSAQGGTNHLLPWVSTAIESTASTLGNIAATAISMGGGAASMGLGGAGAGALGSFVAGGIKQAGKVVESAANVVASSLVGSVPGSFGDPNHPYGELATSNLQRPATAEWRGFMGRGGNTYNISGHDTADVLREANNNEALDRQARLATMRG